MPGKCVIIFFSASKRKIKPKRRKIMNQKAYQVAVPGTIVVVMMAFLSIFFFAGAGNSFAATAAKKAPAVAKTSAVEQAEARIKDLGASLKITEARLNQMKKFLPPFEALYASMTDEQKKSTDTIFRTGKHGKHTIK